MFLSTRSLLSLLLTGSLALASSGSTAPRRGFAGLTTTMTRPQQDILFGIPRGGGLFGGGKDEKKYVCVLPCHLSVIAVTCRCIFRIYGYDCSGFHCSEKR